MTANLTFFLYKKAYPHRITQGLMHVFAWGLPTALNIYALAKGKQMGCCKCMQLSVLLDL